MAIADTANLVVRLSLDDKISGKLKGISSSLKGMQGGFRQVGTGIGQVAGGLTTLATRAAAHRCA
jgi:hypothetical protein